MINQLLKIKYKIISYAGCFFVLKLIPRAIYLNERSAP